jgi:hypothetical protein
LKAEAANSQSKPSVLNALFLLNDPKEEPGEKEVIGKVCIDRVSGSEAMLAMIFSAFSLDPSDKKVIAGNFHNVGQAIGKHLPLYSLKYPRAHECLPEVRAAVIDQLEMI